MFYKQDKKNQISNLTMARDLQLDNTTIPFINSNKSENEVLYVLVFVCQGRGENKKHVNLLM